MTSICTVILEITSIGTIILTIKAGNVIFLLPVRAKKKKKKKEKKHPGIFGKENKILSLSIGHQDYSP